MKRDVAIKKLFILESRQNNTESIVFLHAVGSGSAMWEAHFRALTNFHCIAPDLPGHGKSNQYQWETIDETTALVANIIKTKCDGKAHVVGLSLGGGVALTLLNNYPELVGKAVIDGQSVQPIKGAALAIAGVTAIAPFIHANAVINMLAKMLGVSKEGFANFKRDMKQVRPAAFRCAFRDANSLTLKDSVSHIKSPILFVSGEKEAGIMHRTHGAYAQKIPYSQCFYYPGKGHGWMAEDVETHIALCRYWFDNGPLPEQLKPCAQPAAGNNIPVAQGSATDNRHEVLKKFSPVQNGIAKN